MGSYSDSAKATKGVREMCLGLTWKVIPGPVGHFDLWLLRLVRDNNQRWAKCLWSNSWTWGLDKMLETIESIGLLSCLNWTRWSKTSWVPNWTWISASKLWKLLMICSNWPTRSELKSWLESLGSNGSNCNKVMIIHESPMQIDTLNIVPQIGTSPLRRTKYTFPINRDRDKVSDCRQKL